MVDNSKLFEKYVFNNGVEAPNRLVVAPTTLFSSNPDGSLSDEEAKFIRSECENVGLYILGATAVTQEGIAFTCQPRLISEKDISTNAERAKIVQSQGGLAINQIHHGGALAVKSYSGLNPVAPSADKVNENLKLNGTYSEDTKAIELTGDEIEKIIEAFGKATEYSIKAGYDGIEIHGANNYLLQQFYSAYTNERTDEWGGSNENRMKFPLRVLDACCNIREKLNKPNFIIGYRLSPEEPFENGITMTETLKLVKELVKRPIQYIHISQMNYFQNTRRGEGAGIERLKVIHNETKDKVALIGVGGLRTNEDFYKACNTGFSEFIGGSAAFMLNKGFGTILKENQSDKLKLELDPDHFENYAIPKPLWDICIMTAQNWLPHVKGKIY